MLLLDHAARECGDGLGFRPQLSIGSCLWSAGRLPGLPPNKQEKDAYHNTANHSPWACWWGGPCEVPFPPELTWLRDTSLAQDAQGWVPTGPPCKLQDNKDLQYLCWPSLPPTHFLPQRKMKESDNYFYLPPNCTNYQPISSQCDRHQLWKTHRDKLALIGFPLAV